MENIGLSLSHSVQIQFIAVEMSSFTNGPIHRLGLSLNSNMSSHFSNYVEGECDCAQSSYYPLTERQDCGKSVRLRCNLFTLVAGGL